MRKAEIYFNGDLAGLLEEKPEGYYFTYDQNYPGPAISATLPKKKEPSFSRELFPYFYHLQAEGILRDFQNRIYRLDDNDPFGRHLKLAGQDTFGGIIFKDVSNSA